MNMLDKYTYPQRKVTLLLLVISLAAFMLYSNSSAENSIVKLSDYVASSINGNIFRNSAGADKNISLGELFSVVSNSSSNVFLIWPRENPILLYRYLCSAESWALHHPIASIWYMFTVSEIEDPGDSAKILLEKYPNIKFIYADVDKLMKDTPLYNMIKQKAWEKTRPAWQATHMADFLRQAVLWHKGGYYSDTDIYPVTSLWHKRNFISTSTGHIDPAIMHFDDHHPYNMAIMENIVKRYNPKNEAEGYLTFATEASRGAMVTKCGATYEKDIGKQERNCTIDGHITTFLHENAVPVSCKEYFEPMKTKLYDECVQRGALVFNLCNVDTRHVSGKFGSQSVQDNIGKNNCPFIYSEAQKHSKYW